MAPLSLYLSPSLSLSLSFSLSLSLSLSRSLSLTHTHTHSLSLSHTLSLTQTNTHTLSGQRSTWTASGMCTSNYAGALPATRTSSTLLHLRLTDSCITQLKAQGPSRTCNESKEGKTARCFGVLVEPLSAHFLRILVYLVIYDSGKVSLEHLLLSWYPSQLSQPTLSLSRCEQGAVCYRSCPLGTEQIRQNVLILMPGPCPPNRCRANMAHTRQSRPDPGLGFQVKVFKT